MKILIVDDKAENLYLLQALLTGHGFSVTSAYEGREALALARKDPPDLIVSDILMPGMDGFALCRAWREDPVLRDIPFIFYTATYTDPQDKKLALDLGADRYLVKPTEPEIFMEEVRDVLENRASYPGISVRQPCASETVVLQEYNQALVRKLEEKLTELETTVSLLQASERRLDEVNHVLRSIRLVNQLIVKEKTPSGLIRLACEGLVQEHGFLAAWVVLTSGLPHTLEGAQSGLSEERFNAFLELFRSGTLPPCCREGWSPDGELCGVCIPRCPLDEEHGPRAKIILPLDYGERRFGFLGVTLPPQITAFTDVFPLSREVVNDMAFALHTMEVETARKRLGDMWRATFESAQDGILLLDGSSLRVVLANKAMEDLVGISTNDLVGLSLEDLYPPETREPLGERVASGIRENPGLFCDVPLRRRGGGMVLTDMHSCPLELEGRLHVLGIFRDISLHKEAEERINQLLREKEILLREVHHRIKNNMSAIYSMLRLHAGAQTDVALAKVLEDAASRIQSMVMLYDRLYRSRSISDISLKEYLPSLLQEMLLSFPHRESVTVETDLEDVMIGANFVFSLGIIVTELTTNAMKYAFAGRPRGVLRVTAAQRDGWLTLVFEDDGVGLPEGLTLENAPGFGLQLVHLLVQQARGSVEVERHPGTRFRLAFPL